MDDTLLTTILNQLQAVGALQGHIGAIAAGIFLSVRLYRLPDIQAVLPAKFQWSTFPNYLRYGILLTLAGLGGALASLVTDVSALDALKAAGAAILAAIGAHELTDTNTARTVAQLLVPKAAAPELAVIANIATTVATDATKVAAVAQEAAKVSSVANVINQFKP